MVYDPKKTLAKAAPPFILIVLVQALKATLAAQGIEISDDVLYSIALAIYGGFIGLKNWLKNGHKKDVPNQPKDAKK